MAMQGYFQRTDLFCCGLPYTASEIRSLRANKTIYCILFTYEETEKRRLKLFQFLKFQAKLCFIVVYMIPFNHMFFLYPTCSALDALCLLSRLAFHHTEQWLWLMFCCLKYSSPKILPLGGLTTFKSCVLAQSN